MSISVILVFIFLSGNLLFAFVKKPITSSSDFIVADRSLGGFGIFATLLASNLSAFTIFGVSGAGYRMGWAFFPIMAFGTGFMAISFVLFGIPLRRLSRSYGWLTPAQCIRDRLASKPLALLYAVILLVFTVPYLAVQIGSAGKIIASISGLPPWACSLILTAVIALYIFRGGMRSVVRTDILQALAMYAFAGLAFIVIYSFYSKNSPQALTQLAASGLAHRNGAGNSLPLISLLSYYALWFLADPMFPHLTQRFFAAKSDKALLASMAMYPIASLIIFFMMTGLGVAGAVLFPGLTGSASDTIFTQLSVLAAGNWAPIFSIAALAALMSTMDSQLLSCASILVEDFVPSKKDSVPFIKLVTLFFALASWLVSLKPPASILSFLTGTAFAGYAVLAPVMLAALYFPGTGKTAAFISLIAGTLLVFLQAFKLMMPPIPAVFFNALIQCIILATGFVFSETQNKYRSSSKAHKPDIAIPYNNEYLTPFSIATTLLILFLGTDFWNFDKSPVLWSGVPSWVWYQCSATIVLGIVYIGFYRKQTKISKGK